MRNRTLSRVGGPLTTDPLNRLLVSWWLPMPGWSGGSVVRDLARRNDLPITGLTWGTAGGRLAVHNNGDANNGAKTTSPVGIPDPGTADFTLYCRAYLTALTGKNCCVSYTGSGDAAPGVALLKDTGTGRWFVEGYGNGTDPALLSSVTIETGRVYHVLFSRRAGANVIYVDGDDTGTNTTAMQGGTYSEFCIGSFDRFYDGVNGAVLDAGVYAEGFTADQARRHYEQSLVGYRDLLRYATRRVYGFPAAAVAPPAVGGLRVWNSGPVRVGGAVLGGYR